MVSRRILSALLVLPGTAAVVMGFLWFNFGSSPRAVVRRAISEVAQMISRPPAADVLLPVEFDRQDHALSCEAADLKMALAYRGVRVSESQLLADIRFDLTPKRIEGGMTVWGDPNVGFVGNVDGRMMQDGYGVHWDPVAKAANIYRRAEVMTGGTATRLAAEIARGNPVITWGYLGSGRVYTWTTPSGRQVKAINGEHPVVVHGFKGTTDDPEGFFVVDPIYGKKYMKTSDFMENWESFGYNGVIIY
jgi:uncharacterized protein YvpB